ncbi:MAG: hypothetical protein MI700_14200 [Balneolales bacterium]|nr:hypothetical protein [Balneolales bacterium]
MGKFFLTKHISLFVVIVAVLVAACSPKPAEVAQQQIDQGPEWVYNPPADTDEYIYATATQTSSRQNVARQRSEIQAKQALSQKLGEKVEALQKLFEEEVTDGNAEVYSTAFTSATQTVTSQELVGAAVDEIYYAPTATGGFTAYVLMRMPVGDARRMLDNALSQDEELYIRFKESKAFEELQNNLQRLGLDQ